LAVAELPAGDQLAVIFEAVTERRRLRFSYRGHPRRVDPWRMAYRNGHWFLSGWDHLRQAERLFRMDRLEFAQADSEAAAFERPPGAAAGPPPPWSLGGDESIEASVLVDPVQASAALAVPGAGEMAQQQPDGSVLLHLRVNNRAALRTFVLGFLDHAEVLGPPDLRAEIISWLGDLASRGTRAGEQ
jgi:predicted DNA-binding transcriptional regulator YafY